MADFQFLRTEASDVSRYLPDYLSEDPHFKAVQAALSTQHEVQRQKLMDLAAQFYVSTATWGLSAWERIYQTSPPYGATYELRRAMLKAKIMSTGTMTKANLEKMVNQFTRDGDAYITEETETGCFKVTFPSPVVWRDQLLQTLDAMVPAHLVYSLYHILTTYTGTMYIGGVANNHKRIVISPATLRGISTAGNIYTGIYLQVRKKITIWPQEVNSITATGTTYYGGPQIIHKKVVISPQ